VRAKGAVFLDRDGTIIEDPGYLHRPDDVVLLPGAAKGLAALARDGWPLVIVSNQSGIARDLYRADDFYATMRRLEELLAPERVTFLGAYFCPHHPDFTGPCECRKPGVKLFRDAAAEHGLDLGASWFVGDRWRDVQPAMTLGGRGVLVQADPLSQDALDAARHNVKVVADLEAAARVIGAPRA
jgi:D-glycero-D-manno-heptose 1,7-bisphosphate phosphatase